MTKPEDLVSITKDEKLFAEQVVTAMQKGHVRTPSFKPEFLRNRKYLETIRLLCKQAVYSTWNTEKKPSTLLMIHRFVDTWIRTAVATGRWSEGWRIPSKRTVDRRVNECADSRFWVDDVTPIIAVKAGVYCPNPYLFEGDVRVRLVELVGAYMKGLKE